MPLFYNIPSFLNDIIVSTDSKLVRTLRFTSCTLLVLVIRLIGNDFVFNV